MMILVSIDTLILLVLCTLPVWTQEGVRSRCTPDGVECTNGGKCEEYTVPGGTSLELCICEPNYSGPDCSFTNSQCGKLNCKNGAHCNTNASDMCTCNSTLYTGSDCSEVHCVVNGEVKDNYCKNGGVCHDEECVCPNNTRGDHCEELACGQHICLAGICIQDKCDCEGLCELGCNTTTGTCNAQLESEWEVEAEPEEEVEFLSKSTKVIVGVVAGVILIVILPSLYAVHSRRMENRKKGEQKAEKFKSLRGVERETDEAFLEGEDLGQVKTKSDKKAKKSKSKSSPIDDTDDDEGSVEDLVGKGGKKTSPSLHKSNKYPTIPEIDNPKINEEKKRTKSKKDKKKTSDKKPKDKKSKKSKR